MLLLPYLLITKTKITCFRKLKNYGTNYQKKILFFSGNTLKCFIKPILQKEDFYHIIDFFCDSKANLNHYNIKGISKNPFD